MTDDELDRRLKGWAMWRNGAGRGIGGTTSTVYLQRVPSRYRETSTPRIDGEAMDVEGVVNAMVDAEHRVLIEVYVRDRYQEEAARVLSVSLSTVKRTLKSARANVAEGLRALRRRTAGLRVN